MKHLILLLLLGLSFNTQAEEFDYKFWADVSEYAGYGLMLADYLQTVQIRDKEGHSEVNAWLYGEQPKRRRVNAAFFVQLGLFYLFNNEWDISDNVRMGINVGHDITRTAAVVHNWKVGLKFTSKW